MEELFELFADLGDAFLSLLPDSVENTVENFTPSHIEDGHLTMKEFLDLNRDGQINIADVPFLDKNNDGSVNPTDSKIAQAHKQFNHLLSDEVREQISNLKNLKNVNRIL